MDLTDVIPVRTKFQKTFRLLQQTLIRTVTHLFLDLCQKCRRFLIRLLGLHDQTLYLAVPQSLRQGLEQTRHRGVLLLTHQRTGFPDKTFTLRFRFRVFTFDLGPCLLRPDRELGEPWM